MWHALLEARQSDLRQGIPHALLEVCTAQTELPRSEGDVFADRGAEKLVIGVLEKETDAAMGCRARPCVEAFAKKNDVAAAVSGARLGQQSGEVKECRRLAGSVWSDECCTFAGGDHEGHVMDCLGAVVEKK